MAAVGSAALLAGCGEPSWQSPPVVEETPVPEETLTATTTPPERASEGAGGRPQPRSTVDGSVPRAGGTLQLWNHQPLRAMDPAVSWQYGQVGQDHLISPTFTQPLTYQPTKHLLAMDGMVGYEQVAPLTLVWYVRPGMGFHSGDPIDAEAVAHSFRRLSRAYEYNPPRRSDGCAFVNSFEATGELTVTERWARPNADAVVHRASHDFSFVNPWVVEEYGKFDSTQELPDGTTEDVYFLDGRTDGFPAGMGSGPYAPVRHDEAGVRVERWPDYHGHVPAGDGFLEDGPYIDAWETQALPREVATALFVEGELDVFAPIPPAEVPDFDQFPHVSVEEVPSAGYSVLGMDGSKFHDRRARQALRRAINYEALIEAIPPDGRKYTAPISHLLPHYQLLSQEQLREWCRYDPKQARELWQAASFDVPVDSLRFLSLDNSRNQRDDRKLVEFLAKSFTETLDIQVEEALDPSQSFLDAYEAASDQSEESKGWEILLATSSESEPGRVSGIPYESHLAIYDPRTTGETFLNHHVGSPPGEIDADAQALTDMLVAQDQELHHPSRVELLAESQHWILDRAWSLLELPRSPFTHFGFSSRLRDHEPENWLTLYGLRRESKWLADA